MNKILTIAALALVLSACSNEDNDIQTPVEQPAKSEGIPFTATISIGENAVTRALTEDATNNQIVPTWVAGEKVALIHNGVNDEMSVASVSGGVATITGTITGTPTTGDAVTIIYPSTAADGTTGNVKANLLAAQDGTLATIAANYDVRKGTGTLKVSGTASLNGNVSLTNQFAIFKFTTKNYDASATVSVKPLTITIGSQDYVITPTTATNVLYAALPAISSKGVNFTATSDDSKTYVCAKGNITFSAGKYYQTTLKMIPGALPGIFTVANGKRAWFSQGNLQAVCTSADDNINTQETFTWQFATNQWDYIGDASANKTINGNGSVSAAGTVDLFGWSTTANYYGIHNSENISNYSGDFVDWGTLAITNGGNTANSGWRTPTGAEWVYLFNTRTTGGIVGETAQARYTHATINTDGTGVNGMILFPDGVDFAASEFTTLGTVNGNSGWGTQCTTAQWTALAAKGCMFLPAAGKRMNGTVVSLTATRGAYWLPELDQTASSNNAGELVFQSSYLVPQSGGGRSNGFSVRLVRDAE